MGRLLAELSAAVQGRWDKHWPLQVKLTTPPTPSNAEVSGGQGHTFLNVEDWTGAELWVQPHPSVLAESLSVP